MRSAKLPALSALAAFIIVGCVAGPGASPADQTAAGSPPVAPTASVPPSVAPTAVSPSVAPAPTKSVVFVHPAGGTPDPATPHPAPNQSGPYAAAEFWGHVAPGGDSVYHYDSLDAITKGSDAVVLGTITGMSIDADRYQGYNLGPDGLFINMTLKIDQTLAGAVNQFAPGEINLDVYTDSSQYARFAAGIPNERAIFFLRNEYTLATEAQQPHVPNDKLYYVVINDQALIRDVGGSAVPASPEDGNFGGKVAGAPFMTIVSSIEAAAP
jgi:hypothetical protein